MRCPSARVISDTRLSELLNIAADWRDKQGAARHRRIEIERGRREAQTEERRG